MKIKIVGPVCCNPWHLSALIGDEIEIDDKQGQELIDCKRAELIEESKPKKKKAE